MIELATPKTANFVAANLKDDEICVLEYGREDAAAICFNTAKTSIMSWAVIGKEGLPVCLFGADGDKGDDWGSAWMFSTPLIAGSKLETIRGIRKAVAFSRSHWPELRIHAEDRTPEQIRFIRLLGFTPSDDDERTMISVGR